MKIAVAVCSTIAEEIELSSASAADWVAKPIIALRLRSVFIQLRMRAANSGSSRAVERLLDAVEQVEQHRRAQPAILEQLGHVEAEHAVGEVQLVVAIVKQPGV